MDEIEKETEMDAATPTIFPRGARRESLERRLDEGYRRIDEAELAGGDVSEWESFWIRLLREYEDVCREHDLAA